MARPPQMLTRDNREDGSRQCATRFSEAVDMYSSVAEQLPSDMPIGELEEMVGPRRSGNHTPVVYALLAVCLVLSAAAVYFLA